MKLTLPNMNFYKFKMADGRYIEIRCWP